MSSAVYIIAIVIYTGILLYVSFGLAGDKRSTKSTQAFFQGTGKTNIFVLVFTTCASSFSTWVFMGCPASTYTNGHTWVMFCCMWQLSIAIQNGYWGPRVWRLNKSHHFGTVPEMLNRYFHTKGNWVRYIVAFLFVFGLCPALIAQLVGMGRAMEFATGGVIPQWIGIVYCCVICCIYVFFGGFKSATWVDTFQGLLFVFGLWGGLFIMISYFQGGLAGMYTSLAAYNDQLILYATSSSQYWNVKMVLSFCAVSVLGGGMWPTYGQRWTAANKGQDLVKLGFYMPLLTAIGVTLPGGLVGMMGNLMDIDYPTLNDVFTMATAKVVPFWGVIVTVGVLAAGMSTVAGTLSCASMIISKDVVSHVKKDATDKQVVHAGRVSVVIITILAFLCSLRTPSSITMLIQISGSFFILALIPYSGLFLFRRVTTPGVIAGMLGGLAALTFFTFRQPNFLGVATGLWSFGTGVVLCIVVSLLTSPIPQEERARFLKPLKDHRSYSVTRVD